MTERDKYRPKTPPAGVRAQTAKPYGERALERQPISHPEDFDSLTPIDVGPLEQIAHRQRRTSMALATVRDRIEDLELGHVRIAQEVAAVGRSVGQLVATSDREMATREARAEAARLDLRAAEERKERADAAEREAKSASRKLMASILVPTIAAILSGIAVIIAAMRSAPPAALTTGPAVPASAIQEPR